MIEGIWVKMSYNIIKFINFSQVKSIQIEKYSKK